MVLADRSDRGRLRALISLFLVEADLGADCQIVEASVQHAVAMKVDLAPFAGREHTVV